MGEKVLNFSILWIKIFIWKVFTVSKRFIMMNLTVIFKSTSLIFSKIVPERLCNYLLHYVHMEGFLNVVRPFTETQLDYSNWGKCSKINSIIVGLYFCYVNVNNTVRRYIYFVNVRYAMSTRARTGRSLVIYDKKLCKTMKQI